MNFIKSDSDLKDHYKNGKYTLSESAALGSLSIGFIAIDLLTFLTASQSGIRGFFIINIFASITGTVGIILRISAKKKIRDVMNYAKSKIEYEGCLKLQKTDGGFGLVLSF